MRRQRARGREPHLAAPGDSALLARAAGEGFPVHPVAMRGTWDVASALALAALLRSLEPEVVHWHAARAHALGAMASLLHPGPARVLSRRVVFPVRRSIGSRLLYALPVDRIAAISQAVRDALVRSGVDSGRIDVVPSGIEILPSADRAQRSELRRSLGAGEGDVVALTVSALAPGKGHADLLRATAAALERAPGLKLWLAGEGSLEQGLRAEVRSLGLEPAVQFLGFRTDIKALLHAADFFCLATQSEGLGSSILEAMAAGLPVVATAVGGVPEIVTQEVTGVLVPANDPAALAGAMVRMVVDRGSRETMGSRGREHAAHFSADRTEELTEEVYRAALEARGSGTGPGAG
jgi:glycosyltransferase involved in cell wall biosynthesis